MKDEKTKEQFVELRAQGLSFEKIAKELKVSKQTLINWSKEPEFEIANLRAIELEALQEKYYLTKKKRIELFGEKLKVIKEELEERDLSDISTERLFDLLQKYATALKQEEVGIVFKEETGLVEKLADFSEVESWSA